MNELKTMLTKEVISILDILSDGMIITDEKCIVQYINRAYTNFSGVHPPEIIGQFLPDVRPGALLPKILKDLKPIFNFPRKEGTVESYCDYVPIFENDKLIGGMSIIKDSARIKDLLHELAASNDKIVQLDERLKEAYRARFTFRDIIAVDENTKNTIKLSIKAAQNDSTVFLTGESGTGKEMIAQSIHNASNRSNAPFVDVNCAALPEQLLESELFGYVEGAFTGAKKSGKLGLFQIANGGTLFLDEITEMPLNLQAKLLRVLQENKIRRIGEETPKELNVRIIAATNRNIMELIKEKAFRDDLFFRLAIFPIRIPSLRERKNDINLLVEHFLNEHQRKKKHIINISDIAMQVLLDYNWPGNVRELKNAIEYAVNITDNYIIDFMDLPPNIIKYVKTGEAESFLKIGEKGLEQIVEEVERRVISDYINIYGFTVDSKKQICGKLNISMSSLYNKIKRYNLSNHKISKKL